MENKKETFVKKINIIFRCGALASFSAAFFLCSAVTVHAASMSFSPASGNYAVGKTFSVGVYVSSADQSINAISGALSFPADILEITSISKSGSVINLWVQDPSFFAGGANFEGIALNPGFTGSSGKIITVNFKVKGTGTANVTFSSASVLANDGRGTNVLSGVGSARYTVAATQTEPDAPESTTPAETPGVPSAQKIYSSTHPDPEKWFNNNNPIFSWQLPAGTTGVNFLADRQSSTNPGSISDGMVTSQRYSNSEDGVWYMHLRLRNSIGWGAVSHYRFQIDTQNPESFTIKEVTPRDKTEPASFIFEAVDATSGIDYYEIQVDGGPVEKWQDDGSHIYRPATVSGGKHSLIAKAVDRAGNSTTAWIDFETKAIEPPVFTDYPSELTSKEILVVTGDTYPGMTVVVFVQSEKGEPEQSTVLANDKGEFTFIAKDRLPDGVYTVWAEAVDANVIHSAPSAKLTIYVRPTAVEHIASQTVIWLSVLIPLVGLLLLLILMLWYFWYKYRHLSKKLSTEVREAEAGLHESFDILREHVREQVKMLEQARSKRELTKEENRIIKQLRRDLDTAEKSIRKEIDDIKEIVE